MVFVTQCPEMILLRQFTPVCLLPVKIKILLDDSKINLLENTEFYGTTSPTVTCPSAQLCRLEYLHETQSLSSFLRSPGDSLLVKIQAREFAATGQVVHSRMGFCTLCFYFPTKMLHLNAPFFPLKCSVFPKNVTKMLG